MTTLAERKSERDYFSGRARAHLADGLCIQCRVARKTSDRCEEWRNLKTEFDRAVGDIRTWFDPPPDTPTLFDD